MNPGVVYALGAYTLWGLFPLYFKLLHAVPAMQILAHRMVWSLLLVLGILIVLRRWSWMKLLREQPAVLARFAGSALLLATNWFTYIWSVNHGHVVEASLGYYINPLMNVALGTVLLHERLRPAQWAAVGVAALGVVWMTTEVGHVPWIALVLAFSFAGYSLLRKTAPLGSLEGLAVETAVLFPLALAYLGWESAQGHNVFAASGWDMRWLLVAAGPVTTIPLLLFAAGARRIPFSLLGILQYLTPTVLLILGVWLYHEPFGANRAIGFGLVWAGIGLYLAEGLFKLGTRRAAA
ncbi:MAG: EamA family transporter RarD [Betaproteobacteria bacterium]|jgi:chloramphenicol-sensitive protein RarD|uniref:Protein RarD n=1 Tax=Thiomonas delicata TaxID=364030 RepID=A0A238D1S8_THIDL|nr:MULTISPECIES: EamA family transporter RarD [Thiomonas]MDE2128625.1 EamA family transporter RarD [Betaproteobacteria bacterium]OZB56913.1 MAG: EamA family transporter [Thiomonas sp. 13-66-29]SBP87154.1 Protein RarD [Thiomonas delicata]